MPTRTVKVLGWGMGVSPAKITATLDGNTVFNGQVDLAELTTDNEKEQTAPTLFTFDLPMAYAGTMHMTVSVAGATVRFGQIIANYMEVDMGNTSYSSGANNYLDVAEYDADYVRDPRSNVTIDNIAQPVDRTTAKGTWHWTVSPGSTLEHDLIISNPGLAED